MDEIPTRNMHHACLSLTGLGRKDVVYDCANARHVVLQLRNNTLFP